MTSDPNDTLQRAISYLGAVEVAPGKIAFQQGVDHRWWVAESARVAEWSKLTDASGYAVDAPTNARYGARLMPSWWRPDKRTVCGKCKHRACVGFHGTGAYARITASLETGAEVPA